MRLRIQLPAKAGSFRISNCEVEKVLTMPDEAFQAFLERPVTKEDMVTKYDYGMITARKKAAASTAAFSF